MVKAMTWEKLEEMINDGYGQGHGEFYRPFLQIRRRSSSPKGNQSVGPLPGYARAFHALTRVERQLAMLCLWLGATDVREQLPAWPFPHPHPLTGAEGANTHLWVSAPGLIDIAAEANINHGVYPGTDIPYVATLDVVATVPSFPAPALVVISCKGSADLTNGTARMFERLELERRYCNAIGAHYHVGHELAISPVLLSNLQVCGASVNQQARIESARGFHGFRSIIQRALLDKPIRESVAIACKRSGLDATLAWSALHLLLWRTDADIDLSLPLVTSEMAVSGGKNLRGSLMRRLLRETTK